MPDYAIIWEWLSFAARWTHVITAVAWIGSSFYFIALDLGLRKTPSLPPLAHGEEWQVHGGGFYHITKYLVAPEFLPEHLIWFKWESYATWLSGFCLLVIVYYVGADLFLIDRHVLDVPSYVAIAISVASIVIGWFIYDTLCKSPVGNSTFGLMAVLFVILTAMAWIYTQLFTGRAAMLHMGIFTATIMTANVAAIIIPNQTIVVADLKAGRVPDAKYGKIAKQRSLHNNYLTLPVIFFMLSSHYPLAFATQWNWLIASLIFLEGAIIRHWFNTRHAGKGSPTWTWAAAVIVFIVIAWLSTAPKLGDAREEVASANAQRFLAAEHFVAARDVILGRCSMCHTAEPGYEGVLEAPKNVHLDTDADIANHAEQIAMQAGFSHAMPPGNVTEMTAEERALVVAWFREGGRLMDASDVKVLRGRVLSFVSEPQGIDDTDSYRYIEDGAVVIGGGKIVMVGEFNPKAAAQHEVIDHRGKLILPGLIDPHIHFPQMQVIGSYAANLLEWLNTYTFVEEQRFADAAHSNRIASLFFDELIRHGTTTAAAYCTIHPASVDAFFGEAARRDMLMVGGKVMMDRNAPEALRDTPQSGYDDSKMLLEKWHGQGRAHYAITPRFAITSTHEQMEMAEALAREYPDVHIQTHVDENMAEVEFARELFPNLPDYLGIYERYHLLGPKTLLGHCIHMTHREVEILAATRSVAVWCPTSNLFIGSGLFDHDRLHAHGARIAVATDVGGGSSYSMLRTLDEGYKVLQLRGQRLNPLRSFYMMTLGNARAMSLDDRIGTVTAGMDADLVVLDARATPQMALRMEAVDTLANELFLLQTCGDDRAVVETYVAGRAMKSGLN